MHAIDQRLHEQNIQLPLPSNTHAYAKNVFAPYRIVNGIVYVSGAPSMDKYGNVIKGLMQSKNDIAHGQFAARRCAISLLGSLKHALDGDWNRLQSLVRLEAFIACSVDFQHHPHVANGASVWIEDILQEKSKHTRFAVGAPSLPLGCVVEIALIAQLTS